MDTILVLCQGRRQSALIARTLRYRQIYSLPLPLDTPAQEILSHAPRGIVISAPDGAEDALERLDPALLESGIPILALGAMVPALCRRFGGQASPAACPRGAVTLGLANDPLFENISGGERVLRSLSDLMLSEALAPLATATERPIGFSHRELPLRALQFTIERNDPDAAQLLFNFAHSICGAQAAWDEDAMTRLAVERIREAAPEGRVLCAVSGGVDSAVCARLASLAVGDRLMCVFVDTGLFRQGEPESVISTFMDSMGLVVALILAAMLLSGVPVKMYLKSMKAILFIVAFTSLLNLFYGTGDPIFQWGFMQITMNGIYRCIFIAIRITALILCSSILTFTTSPTQLTDAMERLMKPLKLFRVPVHDIAMMMTIALRFVPTLLEETDKIMSAQKARGADMESGGLMQRIKALIPILIPLFVSAFRRAYDLAMAMECRCYNSRMTPTKMKQLHMTGRDAVAVVVVVLVAAGVVVGDIFLPALA